MQDFVDQLVAESGINVGSCEILKQSIVWTSSEIPWQISRGNPGWKLHLSSEIISGIGVPIMHLSGAVPIDGWWRCRFFKLCLDNGIIIRRLIDVAIVV